MTSIDKFHPWTQSWITYKTVNNWTVFSICYLLIVPFVLGLLYRFMFRKYYASKTVSFFISVCGMLYSTIYLWSAVFPKNFVFGPLGLLLPSVPWLWWIVVPFDRGASKKVKLVRVSLFLLSPGGPIFLLSAFFLHLAFIYYFIIPDFLRKPLGPMVGEEHLQQGLSIGIVFLVMYCLFFAYWFMIAKRKEVA